MGRETVEKLDAIVVDSIFDILLNLMKADKG